jgi:uncharacterized integral membrane protein
MSRLLFILSLILAAGVALMVSAMNAGRVEIELAFARFAAPLGIALVVAFTIGLLAGLFWRLRWIAQLLGERGRLRRALRLAEDRARTLAVAEKRAER